MKLTVYLSGAQFGHRVDQGYPDAHRSEFLIIYSNGVERHTLTGTNIHKDLGFLSIDEMLEWFHSMIGKNIEITVDTSITPYSRDKD